MLTKVEGNKGSLFAAHLQGNKGSLFDFQGKEIPQGNNIDLGSRQYQF